MALVALWSLLGDRTVLLVDGIASTAIGVLFVLAAVGLLLGGGLAFHSVLYVVFGSMFISSGLRNYREYFHLARLAELEDGPDASPDGEVEGAAPSPLPRLEDLGGGDALGEGQFLVDDQHPSERDGEEAFLRLNRGRDLCVACHADKQPRAVARKRILGAADGPQKVLSTHQPAAENKCKLCHAVSPQERRMPEPMNFCFGQGCHQTEMLER